MYFLKSSYFEFADKKLNWDAKLQKFPQKRKKHAFQLI